MNQTNIKLASELVSPSYIQLANNSLNARENIIKIMLSQRCLPEEGLDDLTINYILNLFALMDTNNFINKIGVGERESRIYSSLVSQRHYFMGHGIGRSGDVSAIQPKAAGSSLIYKLTKHFTKNAIKLCGYQDVNDVLVVPLATGMALSMCLLYLKSIKPQAKYVIWTRIDQKTCLKQPVVIENLQEQDCVKTNLPLLEDKIKEVGVDNIVCVMSTTSCFAPRIPDKIEEIAIICKKYNVAHLINNAYGLQCSKIANQMNLAHAKGRIDLVVQSTDKNFMVPVGGSVIYSYDKPTLKKVSELYPGRASAGPILDLFITFLSMGKTGWLKLLKDRKEYYAYFKEKLKESCAKYNEKVLETKENSISLGITLSRYKDLSEEKITQLGGVLYSYKVMGSRVLTKKEKKKFCGIEFSNYGSHIENYSELPYMTVACAIGMKKEEIDEFIKKLEESFKEL